MEAPAPARNRIDAWLQKRFALRVHMTLILAATFVIGLIMTKLLAEMHLTRMWVRYMLAVAIAYAGFLGLIRFWLFYLGICARRDRSRNALDLGDFGDAFCNLGSTPLNFWKQRRWQQQWRGRQLELRRVVVRRRRRGRKLG